MCKLINTSINIKLFPCFCFVSTFIDSEAFLLLLLLLFGFWFWLWILEIAFWPTLDEEEVEEEEEEEDDDREDEEKDLWNLSAIEAI